LRCHDIVVDDEDLHVSPPRGKKPHRGRLAPRRRV
jgi:hypothetical protein